MISQLGITLFDIHANPADGYGFYLCSVSYSVTRAVVNRKNRSLFSINYRRDNLGEGYDKHLWLSFLGFGKRFYLKRHRPTRPDNVPYWSWYEETKALLKKEYDLDYYFERYAITQYLKGYTPQEAMEWHDIN